MSTMDDRAFRVWDNEYKEYVHKDWGVLTQSGELYQILPPESGTKGLLRVSTSIYIPERCTGLKDCADKLIYENDRVLVSFRRHPLAEVVMPVEEFVVTWRQGCFELRNDHTVIYFDCSSINSMIIVGTIHDKEATTDE